MKKKYLSILIIVTLLVSLFTFATPVAAIDYGEFSALRFNPDRAPDATVTTGTGANAVVYNVYREVYCLNPVPGLNEQVFMITIRVPISLGGVAFDPAEVFNSPILFFNPWSGDAGGTAPLATAAATGLTLDFLREGWVTVNAGMRGNGSTVAGYQYGKLPGPIADLKAALRYLHFNNDVIPGDAEKIVFTGSSSGGSATVQMAASGNVTLYEDEIAFIGGLPLGMPGVRDDIWCAAPSCAVMMRGNADCATAWGLFGDLTDAVVGVETSKLNRAMTMEFIRYLEDELKLIAQYDVPEAGIRKGDKLTNENYAAYIQPNLEISLMYYFNFQMTPAGDRAAIEEYLKGTKAPATILRKDWITPIFDENDVLIDVKVTGWEDYWRYNSTLAFGYADYNGGAPNPMRAINWRYDDPAFQTSPVILDNGVIASGTLAASSRSMGIPTVNASIYSKFGIEWVQAERGVTFDQATLDLLEFQRNSVDPMYFLLEKQAGNRSFGNIDVAPNWITRGGSFDPVASPITAFALQAKLLEMGYNCDTMMTWDQTHASTNDVAGQMRFIKSLLALDYVTPTAYVEKLNGNKNNLTVTVTETYVGTQTIVYSKTFSINNNAADTYKVGPYSVYVDTKGNDQIRACYIK